MTLEDLLGRLSGVKAGNGEGEVTARCPAHDDHRNSLSIGQKNGKLLVHCHAGCPLESIVQAIGIKVSDLFTERRKPKGKIVATYDYTDEAGRLLYQAVRMDPKDFRQRKSDGNGGWVWKLGNVRRVLYRLPKVIEAVTAGKTIFIPEGEKDVHTLETIGLTATTNAGGAGKWREEYSRALQGAAVVILPDNDEPGRSHAEAAANSLTGLAASVRVLDLPGLPLKGDVSDWLRNGGSHENLLQLASETPEWTPTEPAEPAETLPGAAPDGFSMTDLGNAERFIHAHGANLRFNVSSGHWLAWTGKAWRQDDSGKVHRLARGVIRQLYPLLVKCQTTAEREALYSHAKRSESAGRLEAMLNLARFCEGVPVTANRLDADHWLLNCPNGTLDLRTGGLREHRQADLITKLSPVCYDPDAKAFRWERFLDEVFAGNRELVGFTKRMAGYCLTGNTDEQAFFILQGKGSNGKGVFSETLRYILGDYAANAPVTTFTDRRDNTFDLPALAGARLVTASEGEDRTSFNESLVKALTGQDPITCCYKFRDFFTYTPSFKIVIGTNEVPRIRSQNYAMKRRVKLLPFRVRFHYEHEQQAPVRDEGLADRLKAEAEGILAWAVQGCIEWQSSGLGMPDSMIREVDSLFESMDPLLDFVEECCELHPRHEVETAELFRAYSDWCEVNKQKPAFRRPSDFSRSLCSRDSIEAVRRGHGGARFLSGIRLCGDAGDANTHFPIPPPVNRKTEEGFQKREFASPGVTGTHKTGPAEGSGPPDDPCTCGENDWRFEPFAFNGNGGWVCAKCYTATQTEKGTLANV